MFRILHTQAPTWAFPWDPSFTFDENSYCQIFEDWNADLDIPNTAQELYDDIDRLEL